MQHKFTNELIHEKSPYLLQHAHNPVNWLPWGKKAFEKAERENKIIFLSVGYSTCHWCHVMERESFENEEIAGILNQHFVPVKVDREERPDVDNVYMGLAQAIGAGGGWPLNLFLTPDRIPFAGGTYFPPEDSHGRAGFKSVLNNIAIHWNTKKENVESFAEKVRQRIASPVLPAPGSSDLKVILKQAEKEKLRGFDRLHGGFSPAPKFPMGHGLSFLLQRYYATGDKSILQKITFTLDKMASGGIYDQIGGGFHRYSTDALWLAPHFEKMLYDQALLIKVYLEAYQITQNAEYARIVRETIGYLRRDMLGPEGGVYSAEDADSEGEEGTFYIWTPAEINEAAGEKAGALLMDWYGLTPEGNFEGKNILTRSEEWGPFAVRHGMTVPEAQKAIGSASDKLLRFRAKRVRPHLDDKIMTDWNGLLISALSLASRILPDNAGSPVSREVCLQLAKGSAAFVMDSLTNAEGRLVKSYRQGATAHLGFIEDYAFFTNGLLDLYEASFDLKYLREAFRLAEDMKKYFWDKDQGGFFFVARDQEQLIQNPKELYDGAIPSGNSTAALVFLRLAKITGKKEYEEISYAIVQFFSGELGQYPSGYTQLMQALDWMTSGGREFVLAADRGEPELNSFTEAIFSRYLPRKVVIQHPKFPPEDLYTLVPFIQHQGRQKDRPTFYLCENHACKRPTGDAAVIEKLLDEL